MDTLYTHVQYKIYKAHHYKKKHDKKTWTKYALWCTV